MEWKDPKIDPELAATLAALAPLMANCLQGAIFAIHRQKPDLAVQIMQSVIEVLEGKS